MESAFDIRLIQVFSGDENDLSISEWIENVELVCRLTKIKNEECVLALRLKGRALKVYHQLTEGEKKDASCIKKALLKVFGTDSFVAYGQFVNRKFQPGETPEEFLADLRRLARSVGGDPPKEWIMCAFVSGLPKYVQELLQASARMDSLSLDEIVSRARAIMSDDGGYKTRSAAVAQKSQAEITQAAKSSSSVVCYKCSGINHLARDCLQGRQSGTWNRARKSRGSIRCYRCNMVGHLASECSGNAAGDGT